MRVSVIVCALAAGCTTPAPPRQDPTPVAPETAAQLEAFYGSHGGRDALPAGTTSAVEALLYGQDDIAAGDFEAARARLDAIFATRPASAASWRDDVGVHGINVGDPIAYYGLRMLDHIVRTGPLPTTATLRMTAVVAPCAEVSRPTLPDLEPETVDLSIHPDILADDARVLHQSTDLFRRWVTAITRGSDVELVVHELSTCTRVTYTDDGEVVVSYPDATAMVDAVPDEIAAGTDLWWVVAPSGVPGDGSGYGRHFITGGMGGYGIGAPLFLSDDAWFLRKPEHLGAGPYSDVERRAYQPQWFQHEFMHHLFRTWPEFELEVTGHQWFDRSTWPQDFEGIYEADYYAEAIDKRFAAASPTLADGLDVPEPPDLANVGLAAIAGSYLHEPNQNPWHEVTVTVEGDSATWSNAAGVSWSLSLRDGALFAGPDCPYGESEIFVEGDGNGGVAALWFLGGRYRRR